MPHRQDEQAWIEGWEQARRLKEALLAEKPLPVLPYVPVRLQAREVAHAELVMDYSRYYGQDVTYQQRSGFYFGSPVFVAAGLAGQAIGNASARSRAQAMAAPQWREFQRVVAYLTNQRIIALIGGHRWLSWWHGGIMQAEPLLEHWSLVQLFEDCEPLRWQGPCVPWLAVAVVYLGFGTEQLRNHPRLAPLTPPTAGHGEPAPTGMAADQTYGGHEPPW